ncbi:MAG: glycoside hydrolase family 18 [Bacteroidales bacterium]|nr:glycoside hydrolase family 18 [Bacteroidales bacterium]
MRNRIFSIVSFLTALAVACSCLLSCHETEPEPEPEPELDPEIVEPEVSLNPRVPGRIATAYVTYYDSLTPDPFAMTHINYAFAELYVRDNVYQGFKLQGNTARFASVAALKEKNPDLKIMLSFTHGVSNSDNKQDGGFSAMSASEAGRKAFAEDCLAFLKQYGIDGIDLDWEFPGLSWSGAACDPSCDTQNYVLLMKQLRETLGDKYLLSYAGYCSDKVSVSGGYKYVDIAGIDPYVDFVNIMAYDFDEAPHHHSALSDTRAYKDCERAVKAYLDAGVDPGKLVLGIPFYGRHSFSTSPTAITYQKILRLDRAAYRRNQWDAVASCPYVATMGGAFYCGYDNPRSIGIKGDWVLAKGMPGLMYWEYDQDDAKGTLRKAVWNAVMK